MNKVLIVDTSDSDRRLMSSLLVKPGYEPIAVESMEAAKEEVAKLPPGAVIVADYKLPDGSAKELVNWLKSGKHYIPVIAIVNNRTCPEATDVMESHGAVAVIQRPAIDKPLTVIEAGSATLVGKHNPTSTDSETYKCGDLCQIFVGSPRSTVKTS